ncbi:MAG: hypothetical protein AB9873_08140 [Syntrophobacteraceae bacterium]
MTLMLALTSLAVFSANAEEMTCSSYDGHLKGSITDKLIVDTDCVIEKADLRGNVDVLSPFTLTILESVVRGNIECQNREYVTLQNSKLYGNISNCTVQKATGKMPNGKDRIGVLYLFQKMTAQDAPWPIIQGGAWGLLNYSLWGDKFNFKFKGQNLTPGTSYTLIYYPDPWPGESLICLASGVADRRGNLNLSNYSLDIGTSLPATYDANYAPIAPSGAVGAKIWLVLSSDVDCGATGTAQMVGWNPSRYLFEYNLINFEFRQN